jgi:hypothetical protein
MFRYVLSLTFAVSFASATTISTSASCDGVTTVGTFGAHCNDGHFEAYAGVGAPLIASTLSFFDASVRGGPIAFPPGMGGASANFFGSYVFTVFGGTGKGFFIPVPVTSESGGMAEASFAGLTSPPFCAPLTVPCLVSFAKPFTFGVPQIVDIGMSAEAGSGGLGGVGDAGAGFSEIAFADSSANPLSNVSFTLVSVDLPEPSSWSLLAVGLMFLLAVAMIGRIAGTEE